MVGVRLQLHRHALGFQLLVHHLRVLDRDRAVCFAVLDDRWRPNLVDVVDGPVVVELGSLGRERAVVGAKDSVVSRVLLSDDRIDQASIGRRRTKPVCLGEHRPRQITSIAPAHHEEAVRIRDSLCHECIYACEEVLSIALTEALVISAHELLAITRAPPHVGHQHRVALIGEHRDRIRLGLGRPSSQRTIELRPKAQAKAARGTTVGIDYRGVLVAFDVTHRQ